MSRPNVTCPVCRSADVQRKGRPRHRPNPRVAGVPIRLDDLDLGHYRCRRCTYQFVSPAIPQDRLLACYAAASGGNWSTEGQQVENRSYALKRRLLERYSPGRRVLDFGCFDGGFLGYLGKGWERFGIEPATQAAEKARDRGIRIIGPTVESLGSNHDASVDAIVVFDVMEHLTDPVATLTALASLLVPGGVILIETGNTGSAHWRLIGLDYYYCAIVEHVGFFNKRSIGTAGELAGLSLESFAPSTHNAYLEPLRQRLLAPLHAGGYYALRALSALRLPLPPRLSAIAAGGSPAGFERYDHFLAVLRRRPQTGSVRYR